MGSLSSYVPLTGRVSSGSKPIVVGVLMNSFLQTEGANAGGNVHTIEVVRQWVQRGFKITVFAPHFAEEVIRKKLDGVDYVQMPTVEWFGGRVGAFLSRALLSACRRHELARCQALFASSPTLADVVPLLLVPRLARVVFLAHILDKPWLRRGPLFRNTLAWAQEALGLFVMRFACDATVTCSRLVAEKLQARGVHQPCYVTTNGAEHVVLQPARALSGAICVARLHPTKGIDDLLRAWAIVTRAIPDATLRLIGNGDAPYRAHLAHLTTRLKLKQNVVFAGSVSDADRDEYIGQSAVFVFPSYEEGWGIAMAEAMASGLPCVTYDLPVFREVFPRGRLAAPLRDVEGLARAIVMLLQDSVERERLAAEALELSVSFSWKRAAEIDARAVLDSLNLKHRMSARVP